MYHGEEDAEWVAQVRAPKRPSAAMTDASTSGNSRWLASTQGEERAHERERELRAMVGRELPPRAAKAERRSSTELIKRSVPPGQDTLACAVRWESLPALPFTPSEVYPDLVTSTTPLDENSPSRVRAEGRVSSHKARGPFVIAADERTTWVAPLQLQKLGMKPPIWCLSRQELCETLSYFKSYQGGHYDKGDRCLGYLVDAFPARTDCCVQSGRVLIGHAGGCGDPNIPGQLRCSQDRDNPRVRALINCSEYGIPVVVIVGSGYAAFPRLQEMGVRYAVLGYYLVTAYWPEAEPVAAPIVSGAAYHVRYKFKFSWVESQGKPWFVAPLACVTHAASVRPEPGSNSP